MQILITSLHLHLGTGICFISCDFLLGTVCISFYTMRFIQGDQKVSVHLHSVLLSGTQRLFDHPVYSTPRFCTVRKKPMGNWRLRTIYFESTHMNIPVASPLRKTASIYGIGSYSMWIPKPDRSSGDASVCCLLFVVCCFL